MIESKIRSSNKTEKHSRNLSEKKLKITAVLHSKDNCIIVFNSKYLLVNFMRFYCWKL